MKQKYAQEIQKSIRVGMAWLLLSSSFVQLVLSVYAWVDASESLFSFAHLLPFLVYLALAATFFSYWNNQRLWLSDYLFPILSGLHWVVLALSTDASWGYSLASERILLFGFFVNLMGLCYKFRSLFLALLPILAVKLYLDLFTGNRLYFDIFISFIKFPLLIAFFVSTLRARFLEAIKAKIEVERLNVELRGVSRTDALTGVANRKTHNEALQRAINNAKRFDTPLSLLLIDVDYFKRYNDSLGHPAGDRCLVRLAKAVSSVVQRSTDTFCRVGGEEFTVILPGSSVEDSIRVASRIHAALEKERIFHPHSSVSRHVTVSIGAAQLEDDDGTLLYKHADLALYQAKDEGRNRTVVFQAKPDPQG